MKLNLKNPIDKIKFKEYSNSLYKSSEYVELKKLSPPRSNQQNKYLHVLLGYFALNYGDTLSYVKEEIFKKVVNNDIFETEVTNRKTGEVRNDFKSTSDLDSKELTDAIDRFRTWSSKEFGLYLPSPDEKEFLIEAEIEIEKVKEYL